MLSNVVELYTFGWRWRSLQRGSAPGSKRVSSLHCEVLIRSFRSCARSINRSNAQRWFKLWLDNARHCRWGEVGCEKRRQCSQCQPAHHSHNNNKKERKTCHKESNQIDDPTLFFHWSVSKHNKQAGTLIHSRWVLFCCESWGLYANIFGKRQTRRATLSSDQTTDGVLSCSKGVDYCVTLRDVKWRKLKEQNTKLAPIKWVL